MNRKNDGLFEKRCFLKHVSDLLKKNRAKPCFFERNCIFAAAKFNLVVNLRMIP